MSTPREVSVPSTHPYRIPHLPNRTYFYLVDLSNKNLQAVESICRFVFIIYKTAKVGSI